MEKTAWERTVRILDNSSVFVDCGPMRMFIDAFVEGRPRPDLGQRAADAAVDFLAEVASSWSDLKVPAHLIAEAPKGPRVRTMWQACREVGDRDLTPMAAVAGTIADATADLLVSMGATRATVNNGGDIAIRLTGSEAITVGIRPDVDGPEITHRVTIASEMNVGGVCTSGFGGRSFTRGIASAATIFARSAALADAAATAIANATYVLDPSVIRQKAEAIDPDTDLKGLEVTVAVGDLPEKAIDEALAQGLQRANLLVQRAIILGACIALKGRMVATETILNMLRPLSLSRS